jgi:acetyl-CoA C-acetyltransferase
MMNAAGRVAILGGVRIPFARQNTNYAAGSNLDTLTATLKGALHRSQKTALE